MCVLVSLTLNGCDKTPYHYGKGKFTLLNNLLSGTIQVWLMYQMREVSNMQNMLEAANPFCIAMFSFCSSLSRVNIKNNLSIYLSHGLWLDKQHLQCTLDRHAPIKRKKVKIFKHLEWITDTILDARKQRDYWFRKNFNQYKNVETCINP